MAERKPKTTPDGGEVKQDPAIQAQSVLQDDPAAAAPTPPESEIAENMASPFGPDAIAVVAKCERFRRAGREFGRDVTLIPLAELSEAQLAQLCQEPMLVVQPAQIVGEG